MFTVVLNLKFIQQLRNFRQRLSSSQQGPLCCLRGTRCSTFKMILSLTSTSMIITKKKFKIWSLKKINKLTMRFSYLMHKKHQFWTKLTKIQKMLKFKVWQSLEVYLKSLGPHLLTNLYLRQLNQLLKRLKKVSSSKKLQITNFWLETCFFHNQETRIKNLNQKQF